MMTIRTHAYPLNQALNRMGTIARALDQMLPDSGAAPAWVPALELAERTDAYLIAAELPGVREEQVELSFENNVLTIRGAKGPSFATSAENAPRLHLFERQTGAFERAVRLPEFVEGDRIEARLVNGVLEITIPKSQAAQARRIPIGGTQSRLDGVRDAEPSRGDAADRPQS